MFKFYLQIFICLDFFLRKTSASSQGDDDSIEMFSKLRFKMIKNDLVLDYKENNL